MAEEKSIEKKEEKSLEQEQQEKPTTPQTIEEKTHKPSTQQTEKPKEKKHEATAFARSIPISKKHSMYICKFIKNKPIDTAISELEQILKFKKAIPFKGEIPHRKGMMSGRYPQKASKHFIAILEGLKANAIHNNLDLAQTSIYIAFPNWASRPLRFGGRRAKRTNILLKAKEFTMEEKT